MDAKHYKLIQWTPHPLASAAYSAFSDHYGIILSPDMIWMSIIQAFATHLKKYPNKYDTVLLPNRDPNASKERINIRRDDLIRSSTSNPWGEAIGDFSDAIKEKIGENVHKMVEPTFTTTTPNEKLACQIVMMDILSPYFDFDMTTLCGIPFFTIEGEMSDWQNIHDRVVVFEDYDLGWWVKQLQFVLGNFVSIFNKPLTDQGDERTLFWNSFFKLQDMSGGPYVTGWINVFFPYISSTHSEGSYFYEMEALDDLDEQELGLEEDIGIDFTNITGDTNNNANENITNTEEEEEEKDVYEDSEHNEQDKIQESVRVQESSSVQEGDPIPDGQSRYLINKKAQNWTNDSEGGPTTGSFPSGLSKFPFTWNYYLQQFSMEMFGGFIGVSQDPDTFALRAEIGFGIAEKTGVNV